MSKSDMDLKRDVEAELLWEPRVNAAQIGVTVEKGAVSLLGSVDSYAEKWAAEDATKRVAGVRSVAEDLTVKLAGHHKHTDSEIAVAALGALKWDIWVPKNVTVEVREGRLSLDGEVELQFQRDSAERAVRYLTGVVSVHNGIRLKTHVSTAKVHEQIKKALQRQATSDASSIDVSATGGTVTLSGKASSWHAIEDATASAWSAPGVTAVVDNIHMSGF